MSRINGEKARAAVARKKRNVQRAKARAGRAEWVEAGKVAAAAPAPAPRPVRPLPEKKAAVVEDQAPEAKAAAPRKSDRAKAASPSESGEPAAEKKTKKKKPEEGKADGQ